MSRTAEETPSRSGDRPARQAPGHWSQIAHRWSQVGPPLRPRPEDLAVCSAAVRRWAEAHGVPRVLILGVTAELYHLPWPAGTEVSAVDHTQAMIDALWPGPRADAVCADWTDLPLPPGSRDVALCDGGLTVTPFPQSHRKIVPSLRCVLSPSGLCVFRLYVPPACPETPSAVLEDLLAGRIPNLSVLKLRLCTALQEGEEAGVCLATVWETLRSAAPDFRFLAERIGWPLEHLLAINTYRDCPTRYHFLRVETIRRLFADDPGGFELESVHVPAYPLGERCPTVVFRRRG